MAAEIFRGACFCGQIRFSITAPTKWCAHCHCSMCQRTHGAAVVTWIGVPEDQFHIESGNEALRWYASSDDAHRGFCPCCSSSLFFRSRRWPGEIHVARACVAGEIDRLPQGSVFFDSHPAWFPFEPIEDS